MAAHRGPAYMWWSLSPQEVFYRFLRTRGVEPTNMSAQQLSTAAVNAWSQLAGLANGLNPHFRTEDELAAALLQYMDSRHRRITTAQDYIGKHGILLNGQSMFHVASNSYSDHETYLTGQFSGRLEGVTKYYSYDHGPGIPATVISCPGGMHPGVEGVRFDLLSSLLSSRDIATAICKHLPYREILALYCISRVFQRTFEDHTRFMAVHILDHRAPESLRIFKWSFYRARSPPAPSFLRDIGPEVIPVVGRPGYFTILPTVPRMAVPTGDEPGMRYLGRVLGRDRMVRDILACLARARHRTPPGLSAMLKKVWVLMDVAYNEGRVALASNREFFTDADILNMQLFTLKLIQRLCNPRLNTLATAPKLCGVLLGHRTGLYPVWLLLRFRLGAGGDRNTMRTLVQMKVRYDYEPSALQMARGRPLFGVPLWEAGCMHREAWGVGPEHLLRADEVIGDECARRGIYWLKHINLMAFWGDQDWATGEPAVPAPAELYMDDPDLPSASPPGPLERLFGNVPFRAHGWNPMQVLRPRWAELSMAVKLDLWRTIEDEVTNAQALAAAADDNGSSTEWESEDDLSSNEGDAMDTDGGGGGAGDEMSVDDDGADKDEDAARRAAESESLDDYVPGALPEWRPEAVRAASNFRYPAPLGPADLSSVTAANRALKRAYLERVVLPLRRERAALLAQAAETYGDDDLDAWQAYFDQLGDDFWRDARTAAGSADSDAGGVGSSNGGVATAADDDAGHDTVAGLLRRFAALGVDPCCPTLPGDKGLCRVVTWLLSRLENTLHQEVFSYNGRT